MVENKTHILIKKLLRESLTPTLRLPKEVDSLTDEIKEKIKSIQKNDINIIQVGDDGKNIAHLKIDVNNLPELSKLIVVDIQIINEELYQPHITLAKEIRGLGLASKIYIRIIEEFGHLYSGKGRVMNPMIHKVWDKVANEPHITCKNISTGKICLLNSNKELLTQFFD